MAGYSVTFSVVDQATRQIDAINKRIQQMRAPMERQARVLRQFVDVSGLKKVAEGFTAIARTGLDAFTSLTRIVPVMGAITGAASIAGMVRLVQTWGAWGVELQRNADRIGTTSQQLQQFQNATTLAGGSADNMTESLKSLTDIAAGAFTGRNVDAIAWFNRAGISIRDANGHLRTTTDLLPEVLRYLDGIKNPADRMTAALGLGGQSLYNLDEDFRRSGQTLDQWLVKARQIPTLTAEQIAAEQRYREAIGGLEVAFSTLEEQIGATLATALTPLLNEFNAFVTKYQPQIIAKVKELAAEFTAWLQSDDASNLIESLKTIATVLGQIFTLVTDIAAIAKPLLGLLTLNPPKGPALAPAPAVPSFSDLFSGKVGVGDFVKGRLGLTPPAPAGATPAAPPAPGAPAAPANANIPPEQRGGANYRERAAALTNQLAKDLNLTPTQAAGIVGNLGYESGGLQPGIHEGGVPANQGGVGFAQWTGPRRREFEAWAAANKLDPKSDAANVGFLEYELKGKYAPFVAQLRNTKTLEESTRLTHQRYETPADVLSGTYASGAARLRMAQKAIDAMTPQVAANVNVSPAAAPAPPAAPVAAAPPARAEGEPAQVTGGPPVSGSVDVTITHKNAPPGSFVTASATGDASVAAPRTEQQQLSAA